MTFYWGKRIICLAYIHMYSIDETISVYKTVTLEYTSDNIRLEDLNGMPDEPSWT